MSTYKEDGQGRRVLGGTQAEILLQAKNGRIGNVGPVEEGQQIEHRQNRNHSQVNLGEQFPLRDTRRQGDGLNISICRRWMSQVRIVIRELMLAEAIGIVVGGKALLVCTQMSHHVMAAGPATLFNLRDPSREKRILAGWQ